MRKLLMPLLFAFIACGPSAEEKAKIEQAHRDSVKAADDMMKAAEEAAAEAARLDTLADTVSMQ